MSFWTKNWISKNLFLPFAKNFPNFVAWSTEFVTIKAENYFLDFIFPLLNRWFNTQYGILVYGCTNKTSLHPIYQAQKRIVRAIFFMKNCDSVSGHFRKINLLTVYELHIQSLLRYYFEEQTGNSPSIFLEAELPEQHIIKTRRTKLNCLMPKITRTLIMRNSLETRLLRIDNWLMTNNLIPEGLNRLNFRQKLAEFTQLYIADNQVLHQLFF